MIVVIILRWFFGYFCFSVEGRFPERFINLCAKKGLNLWKLRGSGDRITGCAGTADLRRLKENAEKSGQSFTLLKEHGLPHLIKKYRTRCGLLAGGVIGLALWCYSSGFVWNITMRLPDTINEAEMRNTLREYGLYEGAKTKDIDTDRIIDSLCSADRRISWMTINISGTDAEINVSPNLSERIDKKDSVMLSSMVSSSDGTVTRVNVYNGSAAVKAGDGIRRGQLLVSGVIEYNNGTSVLTDSEACVFARTARKVRLSIPKTLYKNEPALLRQKRDISVFGLCLPASLQDSPEGEYSVRTERTQLTLLGHGLPLYMTSESLQTYLKKPVELKSPQAEELLKNKLALYELFMLSETNKGKVLSRSISMKEDKDSYTLEAVYELEEDVCVKTVISLDGEP